MEFWVIILGQPLSELKTKKGEFGINLFFRNQLDVSPRLVCFCDLGSSRSDVDAPRKLHERGTHRRGKTVRSPNSQSLDDEKGMVSSVENLFLNLKGERGQAKR